MGKIPIRLMVLCLASGLCQAEEGKRISVSGVTASSETSDKYAAARAVDGNVETRWAASNRPPQWIKVNFGEPEKIDTISILGVSFQSIYDNWRRVSISFSDGSMFPLVLPDTYERITITFPKRTASWFKIVIESSYKITNYLGCCELEAYYSGKAYTRVAASPPAPRVAAADRRPVGWRPTDSDQKIIARLSEVAIEGKEHPNLWTNVADVERAKRNIRTRRWAFEYFKSTLRLAEEWVARSDEEIRRLVPKPYAKFEKRARCPECAGSLTMSFERVGKAYCPKCRLELPNDRYPDDGNGWTNPKTGEVSYFVGMYNEFAIYRFDDALRALADAYVLTGEERFARPLTVLMDAIAVIYPTCDKGPKWYPGVGGRLNRPFYQTARVLIYYADEYDLTYYSAEWEKPSINDDFKTRRENVEENFLKNGGEYCYSRILKARTPSLNNGYCDYLQGVTAVGRVLGIREYMDLELESPMCIFNFIENTIDRDGQYFETAFMYSSHMLNLFMHHGEMLRYYRSEKFPKGIDLYKIPKLILAYLRSEADIGCAGHVPPVGDTGPDVRVIGPDDAVRKVNPFTYRRLEYLVARAGDAHRRELYEKMLWDLTDDDVEGCRAILGERRWLTFNAEPVRTPGGEDKRGSEDGRCTLLPGGRGIGILRAGTPIFGEDALLLRWGPTLNHGSPDELNLNLFTFDREVTYDPGYLWAHCRQGWAHATGSHNLVCVNETNQLSQNGSGGDVDVWLCVPGVRVVSANDFLCYASEGVSQYRRTVALMDLSPSCRYVLDIFRVRGGHTHDLNWHFFGKMKAVEGVDLSTPEKSGSLAGPEYEWWKLVLPTGWLKGVKEPFRWNPPPGNGYGFIHHLKRGIASNTCSFEWAVGETRAPAEILIGPNALQATSPGLKPRVLRSGIVRSEAHRPGDFFQYRFAVNRPGRYLATVAFRKSPDGAIAQVSIDGEDIGAPINSYSPVSYVCDPILLGTMSPHEGEHTLRVTAVGKDPESSGLHMNVVRVGLDRGDGRAGFGTEVTQSIKLTLLPHEMTEIVVGKCNGFSSFPEATYAISRRKASDLDSTFVSLVEPYVEVPRIRSIARMVSEARNPEVAALRIERTDGGVDYLFDSPEPSGPSAYLHDSEKVVFGGMFGVVRARDGKPTLMTLYGNGVLGFGDAELRFDRAEFRGTIVDVDLERCSIHTEARLPADGSLDGGVIQFSRAEYSRRSPFIIRRVLRQNGQTHIELDTSSLVMARGLVGDVEGADDVIPNLVPLDRERMVRRSLRTGYFQGKLLRSEDGRELGRVQDVSVQNWHIKRSEKGRLNPGTWFSIVEISPGDEFLIRQVNAIQP